MVFGSTSDNIRLNEVVDEYDTWLEQQTELDSVEAQQLCCYLEGLLADFDGGVKKLFGRYPSEVSPKSLWSTLRLKENFFADLAWMEGGRDVWTAVKPYQPIILSYSPPSMSDFTAQKSAWCLRELGSDVRFLPYATSKDLLSKVSPKNTVLVEGGRSLTSLRKLWEENGGSHIQYDHNDGIHQLREILSLEEDNENK